MTTSVAPNGIVNMTADGDTYTPYGNGRIMSIILTNPEQNKSYTIRDLNNTLTLWQYRTGAGAPNVSPVAFSHTEIQIGTGVMLSTDDASGFLLQMSVHDG